MLTYDDAAHIYRLDGRRIVSVTQALKLAGHIDARFYTDAAAARGTAVHAACEYVDMQHDVAARDRMLRAIARAVELGVDEDEIGGCLEAYESFTCDTRVEYDGIEKMSAHADGTYAGRCDRDVAQLFGERGKMELKTGDEQAWHGYQLALYQLMDPKGSRWAVYLQKNGRYRLRRKFNPDDYRIGRNAIAQAWQALDAGQNVQI